MSLVRIVLLVIALLAAVAAAWTARSLLTAQTRPVATPVEVKAEAKQDAVLIATRTIRIGEKLDPQALQWVDWPEPAITKAMIKRSTSPEAIDSLSGSLARQTIYEGEPVIEERLVRPGKGGFMAAVLPEGMQAISIKISTESGAGGFILPGDRVDVLLTRQDGNRTSETVLSNVRVLAIDQSFRQNEKGEQVAIGKTATLELTPEQAKVLATAEALGSITLALRSLADSDEKAGPQVHSANKKENSSSVTVLRYGISSHVNSNP